MKKPKKARKKAKRETMNTQTNAQSQIFDLDFGFELEEAFALLNLTVVNIDHNASPPAITEIGIISGLLTINDEIELVIKFLDELRQYKKSEFTAQLKILKD